MVETQKKILEFIIQVNVAYSEKLKKNMVVFQIWHLDIR